MMTNPDPRAHLIEMCRAAQGIQNRAMNAMEELARGGGSFTAMSELTKANGCIEDAGLFFRSSIEALALQMVEKKDA